MNIWKILEIEPCKDKQKITEAYREKLLVTNPEDSEEAFKALRKAYEEACEYAESVETDKKEDDTLIGRWMRKVEGIYSSIEKRRDEACWKEVFEDEACIALDTKIEARDRLLTYCMDCFRLPKNIWNLINEVFDLTEQREELCENFPEDYIDFIFREMKNSSVMALELFQGDEYAEYDQYMSLYTKSTREINNRNLEEAEKTLEELKELNIYHPYETINKIRIHLIREEYEKARSLAEDLYLIYPEEAEVILYMGETAFYLRKYKEAEEYYDKHIELKPKSFLGQLGKAECLKNQKKYFDAKELLIEMLNDYPYNNTLQYELNQVNELMIEDYQNKIQNNPDDMETILELGWSYLQNHKIEEGIKLLESMKPEGVQRFSYENLSARLYMEHEEYEKAIEHFKTWEQMIRELPENVTEEYQKDKNRLHLPIYLQAFALDKLGRFEEALEKIEESLSIKKDEEAVNLKAYLLYTKERYEEAIEVCNELEQMNKERIGVYVYRGKSLYELGYYQAAYQDFDRWLQLYPYELEAYIYKMRILIRYNQYDHAREIADYLVSQKVKSDRLDDCLAQIMEETGNDFDKKEAYEMYKQIVSNYENQASDVDDIYRIYYYMAVADENERPLDYVLNEIDKGLSYKEDYIPLLDYKAYLLNKNKRVDEALELYHRILKINPRHNSANMRIGDILYRRKEYKTALEYYEKQRENVNNQTALINIGRAQIELGHLEDAKETCLEAVRMDPEESCLYHNLGLIYLYQKKYDEAIAYYEEALERYKKQGQISGNTREQKAACHVQKNEIDKAFGEYELLRKEKDDPYYYVENADLYTYLGKYQEAMRELEKYGEKADTEGRVNFYNEKKAALMTLSGNMKKAHKFLKKYKNRTRNMDEQLVEYFIIKKDYQKAWALLRDMLEKNPKNLSVYRFVASRSLWIGDTEKARNLAREGLKLLNEQKKSLTDHILSYQKAAIFHAILGSFQAAFDCLEKAQKSTFCTLCKYHVCKDIEICRGIVLDMMGDRKRAVEVLKACACYCKDDTELYFLLERLK